MYSRSYSVAWNFTVLKYHTNSDCLVLNDCVQYLISAINVSIGFSFCVVLNTISVTLMLAVFKYITSHLCKRSLQSCRNVAKFTGFLHSLLWPLLNRSDFSSREYRQPHRSQNRQTHSGALALLQEDRGLVSPVDRP